MHVFLLLYENKGAATPYIFILGGACVMSVLLLIELLAFVSHYYFARYVDYCYYWFMY